MSTCKQYNQKTNQTIVYAISMISSARQLISDKFNPRKHQGLILMQSSLISNRKITHLQHNLHHPYQKSHLFDQNKEGEKIQILDGEILTQCRSRKPWGRDRGAYRWGSRTLRRRRGFGRRGATAGGPASSRAATDPRALSGRAPIWRGRPPPRRRGRRRWGSRREPATGSSSLGDRIPPWSRLSKARERESETKQKWKLVGPYGPYPS